MIRPSISYIGLPALILAGSLIFIRQLTPAFRAGTQTQDHPVIALTLAIALAGIAWMTFIPLLRRTPLAHRIIIPSIILLGLILRIIFFGTHPVYEDDFKRYLWDGAVTAIGENPYRYSPTEVFNAGAEGVSSVPELARLAVLSNDNNFITGQINSPDLTTIYPPASQLVFALAHIIAPFKPWGLQVVFLGAEILGLLALLMGLHTRNLPLSWGGLYWLNPIVIFTTYNGLHMDVLLVAPILAALMWAGKRPLRSAFMLSLAAAIKLWPLLLAPVLFRNLRNKPLAYAAIATLITGLTILSLLPMALSLNESAGLLAYSANWTNSSFLFPGLRNILGLFIDDPNRAARFIIAAIVTSVSLWLGFIAPKNPKHIPLHLLLLSASFVLLSPTGYPWYFIWFIMFLPFTLQHWSCRGLGLLTVGAAVYFARFKLGEAGHYDFYTRVLLPLEFSLPLLVLAWDGLKAKRNV